jgi:hypothetical protein
MSAERRDEREDDRDLDGEESNEGEQDESSNKDALPPVAL